jgi:PAS domain S-box-containing protein
MPSECEAPAEGNPRSRSPARKLKKPALRPGRRIPSSRKGKLQEHLRVIIALTPECVKVVAPDGKLLEMNEAGLSLVEADSPGQVMGKSVLELIAPECRSAYQAMHERVCAGSKERLEFELIGLKGTRRRMETTAVPIPNTGGPGYLHLALARDVTAQKEAEESLAAAHRVLAEQVEGLTRLHDLSTRLFHTRDKEALLFSILGSIVALHKTQWGLLSLADPKEEVLRVGASLNFDPAALAELERIPAGVGACGQAYSQRRPIIVEDTERDPLFAPYRPLARRMGFRSVYSTPLLSRDGRALGVLAVYFSKPHRPTDAQVQLTDMYVRHAADFLEHARAAQENARLYQAVQTELAAHKRAEEAFRESEQRFQALLENSATIIYIKDVQGRYLQINRWHERLFGRTQEQVAGKTDFDIFPHEIAEKFRENDLRVLRTGQPLETEEIALHSDGPHSYISVKFPLRHSDGTIYAVAGISTDITERKRAEEAAQRLAAIVNSSNDAIVGKNLEGIISSWNLGAERIFGYSTDEAIGRSILMLIPPERQQEERWILERIRRGEQVHTFETVRLRKDGTRIEVSLTISPIRDRDGRIVGASKIARDITGRKQAERQQAALYELVAAVNRAAALPQIFEAALDAVCRSQNTDRASLLLYDADKVMRFRAWRGLSEEYRRAVEGHSPWGPTEPNPQPVCIEDMSQARLEPPLRAVIERECIRALAFIPLIYEGRLLGKFMVYHGRSHRFNAEEIRLAQTLASQVAFAIERRRSSEELELLVNHRTASLRKAITQMEEFSYSVSHDLRSPLRAMKGYAQILSEDYAERLDEQGRQFLQRIVSGASRMERLIHDVLTYSRLDRLEMRLDRISLDQLVSEVLRQYPELDASPADFAVQEHLPEVLGHEPSLGQALANLLSNAVKFTRPGERPRVGIAAEQTNGQVTLRIQDNGIGVKPEHQRRLFGLFERIHPEQAYEGTGIGLAIVRKTVERMGGSVGVESDGEHGSTFWLQLPAAPNS